MKTIKMSDIRYFAAILAAGIMLASCGDDNGKNDGPNLTAYFSTDKTSYFVGDEVKFTDQTTGGSSPYTYAWDFGNQQTSTEKNPTMIYSTNGSFKVRLTVTDAKGKTALAEKNVAVDVAPIEEVGNIELKWVSSTTMSTFRSSSVAVSNDGYVYIVSNDHNLRKFDPKNGNQVWAFDLRNTADGTVPGGNTNTTPSIDTDGTIYVGTGDESGVSGRVYAVKPDGTKKWVVSSNATDGFWNKGSASTPRINYLTCTFNSTHVFMGNGGSTGSIISVDKATGKRVGHVANADNMGGPAGGVKCGLVLTKDNTIIWGGAKNGMFGVSATSLANSGNTVWAWNILKDNLTSEANSSPAIDSKGIVYAIVTISEVPYLAAFDTDGILKWSVEIEGAGAQDQGGVVIAADGTVITTNKRVTGEATGGITAFDPKDGAILWSLGIPENVSGVAAIDQAGNIHFGTESGNYYIVKYEENPEPGEDNPKILVKKDLAEMIAASDYAGKADWAAEGARMWTSPAIADDGTIYIAVENKDSAAKCVVVALGADEITGPADSPWPMKGQNRRRTSVQK